MAEQQVDTNAAIWRSDEAMQGWLAGMDERERKRADQFLFIAHLLPFGRDERFTFLDLGAGTGAASRTILAVYPDAHAVLADYSPQMMTEGARAMAPFEGRYQYVEFDMLTSAWPAEIPVPLDAVVTSQCVHHLPDERKQTLFREIYERLKPGGWYVNFDPVQAADAEVEAVWQRINDARDPVAARRRHNPTPQERARHENHVRYMIPVEPQMGFLRAAGFEAVDLYWKELDFVIYGGHRPNR